MKKKLSKRFLPLIAILLSTSSCTFNHRYSYDVNGSSSIYSEESESFSDSSSASLITPNDSDSSSESSNETHHDSESTNDSSSIFSSETVSSFEDFEIDTVEYKDVVNTINPSENKTYRITPIKVEGDEFTVYNVKYDTRGYLAHPTTLTIKKSDYCLTYETVALYYQAFREVPPNYVTDKSLSGDDLRYVSTYTYGSYTGSNSYTGALGTFNNQNKGKYLELDIKLNSYSLRSRGTGRVVIVVDGIADYGDEPVCYFTSDHYSTFYEFYNYATGWGPSFKGVGSKTSTRQIPTTVTPIY